MGIVGKTRPQSSPLRSSALCQHGLGVMTPGNAKPLRYMQGSPPVGIPKCSPLSEASQLGYLRPTARETDSGLELDLCFQLQSA